MSRDANLSVSMSTKTARQEIKLLSEELKSSKLDFKALSSQMKDTADKNANLTAQSKNLSTQLNTQQQITQRTKQAVSDAGQAVEKSKTRLADLKKKLDEAENSEQRNQKQIDRLKTSVENAEKAVQRNENGLKTWENKLKSSENAEDDLRRAINKTNNELALHSTAFQKANDKIENFKKKYNDGVQSVSNITQGLSSAGRTLTYGVTVPLIGLGTAAGKAAVDFEDAFTGVEKTVEATPEQLEEIRTAIRDMAKEIPQTTNDIAGIAETAGQLGIHTDSIALFTRTMADLGVATNLTGEEAASTLAKFANITNMSQDNFDRLGATIVALGNNFATTEADIAAMGMRLAGAGTQIGLTPASILGIATALSSVGIEAEAGGSAFSKAMIAMQVACETGFDKIQGVTQKTGLSLRELQLMSANNSKDFKALADSIGLTSTELNTVIKSADNLEHFGKIAGMSGKEFKELFGKNSVAAIDAFIKGLGDTEGAGASTIQMLQDMGFTEVRLRDSLTRLAGSHDGVSKAVTLGNEAWEENSALTDEAERKYANTASQLQILKNNLYDIGITLGESLLPWMAKASGKVQEFAQWFSNLDEAGQRNILRLAGVAAAIGPVLSLTSKGISVAHGLSSALGMFSTSAAAAGTAASGAAASTGLLSGAMAFFATPAGATIGILALLAAGTYAVVKAYQYAQYEARNYGKYLVEGNQKMQEQIEKSNELRDALSKRAELKMTVDSDTASIEEVNAAQEKLKDSTQWLIDNYGEYLSSESLSTGVITDTDLERLNEALELKKKIAIENQKATLNENQDKFENSVENVPVLKSKRDALVEENIQLEKQQLLLKSAQREWNAVIESKEYTDLSSAEQLKKWDEFASQLRAKLNEVGFDKDIVNDFDIGNFLFETTTAVESNAAAIEDYAEQIEQHETSMTNFKQATRAMLEVMTIEMPDAMQKGGDAVADALKQMGTYGKNAQLTVEEMGVYAQNAALKLNGFSSGAEACAAGEEALQAVLRDTVQNMQTFGYTAEQGAVQAALLANGFSSIEDAAQKGGLEKVAQQATELARKLGLIPDNVKITINSDGNGLAVLDEATEKAKNLDGTTVRIMYAEPIGPTRPKEYATGVSSAPEGAAIVNENGRELIEHKDGSFSYVDSDGPALTYLEQGDTVYTHEESKRMARNRRVSLPGFAKGTTKQSKTAFELKKADFQHLQNTSEVSVAEQLQWWQSLKGTILLTADEAKEVAENIYKLSKSLSEELVKTSNDYIQKREEDSKSWIEKEKKYNHMSAADEIAAYDRMIIYHREELNKMLADERLTQEQKDELWGKYTKKFEEYEEKKYDIAQEYLEKQLEKESELREKLDDDSDLWISNRDFYGDWSEYGDNKLDALMRVRVRNEKDLTDSLRQVDEMYWLSEEEKEEERGKRWEEGNKKLLDLDKEMYSERKKILEEYVSDYTSAQKKEIEAAKTAEQEKLQAELAAIEKKYAALDEADEQEDRDEQRREYEEIARKYKNSATREGQAKYKEALKALEELDKTEEKLARDKKKEEEIEAKNEEIKASEEKYSAMLDEAEEYGEKLTESTKKWAKLNTAQLQQAGNQTVEAVSQIYSEYYTKQTQYLQDSLSAFDSMIQGLRTRATSIINVPDFIGPRQDGSTHKSTVKEFAVAYNNYGEQHYGDGIDVEAHFDDMAYNILRPKLA